MVRLSESAATAYALVVVLPRVLHGFRLWAKLAQHNTLLDPPCARDVG